MKKPNVDIILPCYNPESDWAKNVVKSYQNILADAGAWTPNLIIVNDGSTKGIKQENIDFLKNNVENFHWINYKQNRGKGFALRKGVSESTAEFIVYTDIDFPYTQDSLVNMINELITGQNDVLAGERSDNYYEHTPFVRKVISKFLKRIVRGFLKINVSDTQAGLKGMNKKAKTAFLDTTIDRYLFDIEFLWLAGKKYKISPFPVKLKENIVFSRMNYKILLTEAVNFIKFFVKTLK